MEVNNYQFLKYSAPGSNMTISYVSYYASSKTDASSKISIPQRFSWTSLMVKSIYLWLCSPFVAPWPPFQFLNPMHSR
jgi:hypothetical protein